MFYEYLCMFSATAIVSWLSATGCKGGNRSMEVKYKWPPLKHTMQ